MEYVRNQREKIDEEVWETINTSVAPLKEPGYIIRALSEKLTHLKLDAVRPKRRDNWGNLNVSRHLENASRHFLYATYWWHQYPQSIPTHPKGYWNDWKKALCNGWMVLVLVLVLRWFEKPSISEPVCQLRRVLLEMIAHIKNSTTLKSQKNQIWNNQIQKTQIP